MRHDHQFGLRRREVLQAGFTGLLGLGMADLARAAETAGRPRARSVILVFMTGAPSHQDVWDMKPEAPLEFRGEFRPIRTSAPGIEICEHLPLTAKAAHRFSLVRSMTHNTNTHEIGTHYVLTGINDLPPGATFYATRNDWPCFGSVVNHARPAGGVLPAAVELPTYLNNGYGFSGQDAGFLGSRHDTWILREDPNRPEFRVPDLAPLPVLTPERLRSRRTLLDEVDGRRRDLERSADGAKLTSAQQKAFATLGSARVRRALDIHSEPAAVRERYGRHLMGQSLLLARRLVEAGVTVVQANMGAMNTWDTHTRNFPVLRDDLLPPFDRGFSALIEDLHTRGLLEETLVIALGEFGRSPKVGQNVLGCMMATDGRDHWGGVFTAVFAGGGVRGGRVVGRSDSEAAYPDGPGYTPADLGATLFTALGIDPRLELRDQQDRPFRINQGEVISGLF